MSAGATVASVRAGALRSPCDALAALQDAASGLAAGAEGAAERYAAALARAERLGAWDAERRLEAALERLRCAIPPRTAAGRPLGRPALPPAARLRAGRPGRHRAARRAEQPPRRPLAGPARASGCVEFPGIAVFVTHDRWLLDAVATAIFDLDPALGAGGTLFGGGFPAYREARAGTLREWRRRYAASLDAERELSERLTAARAAAPGHWQPGKGAAKHGRESRAASSVRLLQRRIDQGRRERGPAPPDPLTFTAPEAADTGDTILLEAAGIAVHGRVDPAARLADPARAPRPPAVARRERSREIDAAERAGMRTRARQRHAHDRAWCPRRAPRPGGRLESRPHARRRARRVGSRSDPRDRTSARRRPRTPVRPALGRAAPAGHARRRPAGPTIGAAARRADQPPLGHARRRALRRPARHAGGGRSRHPRPDAAPHGPRLADRDPVAGRPGTRGSFAPKARIFVAWPRRPAPPPRSRTRSSTRSGTRRSSA